MRNLSILLFVALVATACSSDESRSDAYGNFEAIETTISALATGQILRLDVQEGQELEQGQVLGYIDSLSLTAQKAELLANRDGIRAQYGSLVAQLDVVKTEMKNLEREKARVENLIKSQAATSKQLDDLNGAISLSNSKKATISAQNPVIAAQLSAIDAKQELLNDKLAKSVIINPVAGVVLTQLAQPFEVTAMGRPLYKIANISTLDLKAYITGTQLEQVKIGQIVKVLIDSGDGMKELSGTVSWVSSKSEFTPKIIQTKEERVDLVYAFKVRVKNDGALKIGMPAEVLFGE